jgi:1-acyl-sn-glycerol-3-phosphate acyltransferase
MMLWARWMLFALGIRRQVVGNEVEGNKLYVANHVSWVDILVLMATQKGAFVAKSELATWPLLGWMCKRTGTLFLRRGSVRALGDKVAAISQRLMNKESVFCFPEGTTTEGNVVKPFYPGLFQAAIDAEVLVQPVALVYSENGGTSTTMPFVGADDFSSHFRRVLSAGKITAHISFLPELSPTQNNRREIAIVARDLISARVATNASFHAKSIA